MRIGPDTPCGELMRRYTYHLLTPDFQLLNAAACFLGPRGDTSSRLGYSVHFDVPAADTMHWKYLARFSRQAPFSVHESAWCYTLEDCRPIHNRIDRYGQDRARVQWDGYTFRIAPYSGPVPVATPWKAFYRELEAAISGQ
jgi:hypothetical protein